MSFLKSQNFNPQRARLLKDQDGNSQGTGFVQMASCEEAHQAVKLLHCSDLEGRKMVVNMASKQGSF